MIPTFLDVQGMVEQSFMSRMAEQGFTVMLLVVFAVYSLRKIKQLEDKLDKYMSEDREELKEVIMKNTSALERIAGKLVVFILLATIGLSSCITKKVTTQSTSNKDSIVTAFNKATNNVFTIRENNTKDSVIRIPEQCVTDTATMDDLQPLYTAKGDTVANVRKVQSKGITGTITVLPDKRIAFNCRSDSLLLVIRNMTYIYDSTIASYDTQSHKSTNIAAQQIISKEVTKTSSLFDFAKWAVIILFGVAISYCVWCILKHKILF